MSKSSPRINAQRGGSALFLLDADGRVLASQRGTTHGDFRRTLPFGLQSVVDSVIAQSEDVFAAGEADFIFDFPLAVRIFSIMRDCVPKIALYVEPASRRTD